MKKSEKVKYIIAKWIMFESTSPWDGVARFDEYTVSVRKYDGENLSLMEREDERFSRAVDAIHRLIDPALWDQLLDDYQ